MALDLKSLREKETEQLERQLTDLNRHYFDLRVQSVTETLEDPSQIRKTRRDIARLRTLLRERELQQK